MSWVQSGFSWVLLAVQVWKCAGGERCVDLETQKEGKKSAPKGRKAEVTSTVHLLQWQPSLPYTFLTSLHKGGA